MGNFQQQAQAIIDRMDKKSFQFPTLVKETGNFDSINGNSRGNLRSDEQPITQRSCGVSMEKKEETSRKLPENIQETLSQNYGAKSFQPRNTAELLMMFFEKAPTLGIELLHGDRAWLQNILYGARLTQATALLCQYIKEWKEGMTSEPAVHKQQNVGRCLANIFIRENLTTREYTNQHGGKHGQ